MELFQASKQWANRPADERFDSLDSLLAYTRGQRDAAAKASLPMNRLKAVEVGGDLQLAGPGGNTAELTHWAFGQLANRIGAPAEYLRGLPANLAASNLNHGLQSQSADTMGQVLFARQDAGGLLCRSLTSDAYTRIWSADVVERLIGLRDNGWRTPPARPAFHNQPGSRPATEADVLQSRDMGLSIQIGDMIAPAGLYASDRDMFAFMVNESVRIEDGSDGGLARGFFVSNSEVGAASLKFTAFHYRHVCGNHIIWGAKAVRELRIVHRGDADRRFQRQLVAELRRYSDQSASDDESRIESAKSCVLGNTKDEVLDLLFGKRILPMKALERGYDFAVEESDIHAAGSPRTAWGFAQGLTRLSQESQFADKRNAVDRAAGKVLDLAF